MKNAKKEIVIVVASAQMHEIIANGIKAGYEVAAFAAATFDYVYNPKVTGVELEKAAAVPTVKALVGEPAEASAVKKTFEDGATVWTTKTFEAMKTWYEGKIKNVDDKVIAGLNGRYLFARSYQDAGLTARFQAAGFEVQHACVDGNIVITGDSFFAEKHASALAKVTKPASEPEQEEPKVDNKNSTATTKVFTISSNMEKIGTGISKKGGNNICVNGMDKSVVVLDRQENVSADDTFYEAQGAIVKDSVVTAIIFAYVRADNMRDAQKQVTAVAENKCGTGAFFVWDDPRIPKQLLCCTAIRYGCLKKVEGERSRKFLSGAIEHGNFIYTAGVSSQSTPATAAAATVPAIPDDVMNIITKLEKRVEELERKVAEQQRLLNDLNARLAAKPDDDPEPEPEDNGNGGNDNNGEEEDLSDIKLEDFDSDIDSDEPLPFDLQEDDKVAVAATAPVEEPKPAIGAPVEEKPNTAIEEDLSDIKLEDFDSDIDSDEPLPDDENPFDEYDDADDSCCVSAPEDKKEDAPAAPAADIPVEDIVVKFLSVSSVEKTHCFTADEYKAEVANHAAKIQTAVTAVNTLGVDIEKMPLMVGYFLHGKSRHILDDIKVEDGKVFIKITYKSTWQQIAVNSKGNLEVVG